MPHCNVPRFPPCPQITLSSRPGACLLVLLQPEVVRLDPSLLRLIKSEHNLPMVAIQCDSATAAMLLADDHLVRFLRGCKHSCARPMVEAANSVPRLEGQAPCAAMPAPSVLRMLFCRAHRRPAPRFLPAYASIRHNYVACHAYGACVSIGAA